MRIKKNPDLVTRHIAGEVVLIPTGEMASKFNGMINLNGTGAFIWEQLDTTSSREEIVKKLLDTYEVDEETARRDVEGFIATAIHVGYIVDEEEALSVASGDTSLLKGEVILSGLKKLRKREER